MYYCDVFTDKELGAYGLDDRSTGIKVGTLTSGSLTEQRASLIGMSLAKFSRSDKSLLDNAKDIADASASMERIAVGYGHSSVAGMAHVNFHVEDVSVLDSMSFFYNNVLIDGQGRSTRYQNFSKFLAIPSNVGSSFIRNQYKEIVRKQLTDYENLYEPTYQALAKAYPNASPTVLKARTLDCTRYLVPLATKTSFGSVISARSLAQYVSDLGESIDPVQTKLGDLLLELFTTENDQYKSDCSFLMRHTEPSESIAPILNLLHKVDISELKKGCPEIEPNVVMEKDPYTVGHAHLMKLLNPSIIQQVPLHEHSLEEELGILLSKYDHHEQVPQFLKEGFLNVYGFADIGSIKDLNRHRSLHKLVPFLHQSTSMYTELVDRPIQRRYFLPPYLTYNSKMLDLSETYSSVLHDTYRRIEDWYLKASGTIGIYADLYGKRLVPHAHATTYVYSGSYPEFSYLFNLRTRPGGHIQYRMLTYNMLKALSSGSYGAMFKPLLSKIEEPNPMSEAEFIDRS